MTHEPPPRDPIRSRLPDYAAVFGAGLAGAAAVGSVLTFVSGQALLVAFGWTLTVVGVLVVLLGGFSGGGFDRASSGAYGIHYGRHHHARLGDPNAEIARVADLEDRLAAGLRPRANPAAFWLVVAGAISMVLGQLFARLG